MRLNDFLVSFGVEVDSSKLKIFSNQINKVSKEAQKLTEKAKSLREGLVKVAGITTLATAGLTFVTAKISSAVTAPLQNIEDLAKESNNLFSITQENIEQAKKYQEAQEKTSKIFASMRTQLALNLAPSITNAVEKFNAFMLANKALVKEGIEKASKAILGIIQIVSNSVSAINKAINSTIGWKKALLALGALFSVIFVTSPIGLVVSAIAGLMLLLDDLMVYMQGGESFFGEAWEPFLKALKSIQKFIKALDFSNIKKAFSENLGVWKEGIKEALDNFAKLFTYIKKSLPAIKEKFQAVLPYFLGMGKALAKIFTEAFKAIGNIIGLIVAILSGDTEKVKEYFSKLMQNIQVIIENIIKYFYNKFMALASFFFRIGLNIGTMLREAIIESLSSLGAKVKAIFANIFTSIKRYFAQFGEGLNIIKEAFTDAFTYVLNFVKNIFASIYNFIKRIFLNIIEIIKEAFTTSFNFAKEIFTNLANLAKDTFAKFFDFITEPFIKAFNFVKEKFEAFITPILDKINAVKSWTNGKVEAVKEKAGEAFNSAKEGIKNFFSFSSNKEDKKEEKKEGKSSAYEAKQAKEEFSFKDLPEIIVNLENNDKPNLQNISNISNISNTNNASKDNRTINNKAEVKTEVHINTNNVDTMLKSIEKSNCFGIDKAFKNMEF